MNANRLRPIGFGQTDTPRNSCACSSPSGSSLPPETARRPARRLSCPGRRQRPTKGWRGPETPPEFVQRVYVHGLARASPARISERSTGRLPSDHESTNPAEECVATQCRPPDEGRADHLGPRCTESTHPKARLALPLGVSRLARQGGSEELFRAARNDAICLIGTLT